MSQKSKNQGFYYYFCLIIEGSGLGAGPRTYGSGYGRPKIIRIRNTVPVGHNTELFFLRVCNFSVLNSTPNPGSKFFSSPDPGSKFFPSRIRIKEFKYFNPKNGFWALGNMVRVVHPGSGSWFFTHPGSWIQGSKRHRIPDPDPQHCWTHGPLPSISSRGLGGEGVWGWSCSSWKQQTEKQRLRQPILLL